jgi:hypothetical protein
VLLLSLVLENLREQAKGKIAVNNIFLINK